MLILDTAMLGALWETLAMSQVTFGTEGKFWRGMWGHRGWAHGTISPCSPVCYERGEREGAHTADRLHPQRYLLTLHIPWSSSVQPPRIPVYPCASSLMHIPHIPYAPLMHFPGILCACLCHCASTMLPFCISCASFLHALIIPQCIRRHPLLVSCASSVHP